MRDAEPLDAVVIGAGFAGLYMVHRLREQGFSVHGFERGGRRRRYLVLEPLPGGALRLGDHVLLVLLPARPGAGVAAHRAVPGAAGHPALPRRRWPTASTCARTSPSAPRVTAIEYDEAAEPVDAAHATDRAQSPRPGTSSPRSAACPPPTSRSSPARTPSTASACTPETGRSEPVDFTGKRVGRDRHRLVRHPGDPGDRRAGRAPDGVPAHRAVQHPGEERPADRGLRRAVEGELPGMAAPGTAFPGGLPYPASTAFALRRAGRRSGRRPTRHPWDAGGFTFLSGSFTDIVLRRGGQRDRGRLRPGKIGEIVRDPETADMLKPWDFPIGTKRLPLDTELLRDVQPAERHPGRPASGRRSRRSPRTASGPAPASTTWTSSSTPPGTTRSPGRSRRSASAAAAGCRSRTRGARARAPTWAWPCPGSPTCSRSPARAARRC